MKWKISREVFWSCKPSFYPRPISVSFYIVGCASHWIWSQQLPSLDDQFFQTVQLPCYDGRAEVAFTYGSRCKSEGRSTVKILVRNTTKGQDKLVVVSLSFAQKRKTYIEHRSIVYILQRAEKKRVSNNDAWSISLVWMEAHGSTLLQGMARRPLVVLGRRTADKLVRKGHYIPDAQKL